MLYSFPNYTDDGSKPSNLIVGSDGNFYGTTFIGGNSNYGTVFRLTPAGSETVLYSFLGGSDGELPSASLAEGSDGNFYGTTPFGGSSQDGTIFRITPSGDETVLYSFPGGTKNGANLTLHSSKATMVAFTARLRRAATRTIILVVVAAARSKITPTGNETIYLFAASTMDGALPGSLIQGSDGNFYGTTSGWEYDGDSIPDHARRRIDGASLIWGHPE